jgi:hypothetical protein
LHLRELDSVLVTESEIAPLKDYFSYKYLVI